MYKKYFRYIRHLILPNIGFKGQDILKKSKVLCIGAGGLGSPALIYMASAGIGNIDIIDFDTVSTSNLNRQIIFNQNDIGKIKVVCAKEYILKLNKYINVNIYNTRVSLLNSINLIKRYDVVLDCTDNLETKFLINDIFIKSGIPVIHASVCGLEGYISIFTKKTFCYRCLYSNFNNNNYLNYGVLGPVAGIFGSLQALVAIDLLLYKFKIKNIHNFFNKIMLMDLSSFKINVLKINKNNTCNICL